MVSHWLVWMGSRADLDVVTKRERETSPASSAVTVLTELSRTMKCFRSQIR
jgi:hypothetical protein